MAATSSTSTSAAVPIAPNRAQMDAIAGQNAVAGAAASKKNKLNADCQAWIYALWPAASQVMAMHVHATGRGSVICTTDEGAHCNATIEAGVTACRAFKLEVDKIVASTTMTPQEKIAALIPIAWVPPAIPKS